MATLFTSSFFNAAAKLEESVTCTGAQTPLPMAEPSSSSSSKETAGLPAGALCIGPAHAAATTRGGDHAPTPQRI